MEEVGATHSRLRDERAALVVRAKRHAAVARDDREVQALDDGEAADDGAGEGAVADDLVRLLHVDAEEGRKEDGRAGNVALARAEGVADRGEVRKASATTTRMIEMVDGWWRCELQVEERRSQSLSHRSSRTQEEGRTG